MFKSCRKEKERTVSTILATSVVVVVVVAVVVVVVVVVACFRQPLQGSIKYFESVKRLWWQRFWFCANYSVVISQSVSQSELETPAEITTTPLRRRVMSVIVQTNKFSAPA